MIMRRSGPMFCLPSATEEGDWGERLARAWFGVVPRGDSLFTHRLMEVVSAGAIPVIVSDGWILPFDELVDWERVGVVVREDDLEGVVERLRTFRSRSG